MFAHGLMFHHFHDDQHPKGQGAISRGDFERILDRYRGRILSASDWLKRSRAGKLSAQDVCLTFDDALKCQIDVALPVLRERDLTAFWFVYSSVFEGNIEPLEIFRYFRTVAFLNFDHFCDEFMSESDQKFRSRLSSGLTGVKIEDYLADFKVYSRSDRLYRYVRDRVLSTEEYNLVLRSMMGAAGFDVAKAKENLWMTDADITSLSKAGHTIGLHSYTHPIRIELLPAETQQDEYARNFQHLERVIGIKPTVMAHPCNSYSPDTLTVLGDLGVSIGFRSNMSLGSAPSRFEFPREDHANIMTALQ